LKILLLTDGISPYVMGGMQKHSYNLAKYFAKSGVKVTLVHFNQSDLDIEKLAVFTTEEKQNIESIALSFPENSPLPGHYIKSSYQYSALIFERLKSRFSQYQFVIAKGFTAWKLLKEKAKGFECPPVGVNLHGYEMYQKQPNFKSKLSAWMLRQTVQPILNKADFVFSYGGRVTDLLLNQARVQPKKILEIPGGIEASWLNQNPIVVHNPRRFVFVGRYERRKGIEELHEAIKQLPKNLDFAFTFIGPIPKEKQVVDKRVQYLGAIRDPEKIKAILQQQDILVCPSHSEGMPNVILEGMASGLAIIATDVGAVKMMVGEGNGTLIELKDLKNAIEYFCKLNNKSLLVMKENSLKKVKEFFWDKIILKHTEFFNYKFNE
jgi:glycosyltransferase involved in cell wall biosynthesis